VITGDVVSVPASMMSVTRPQLRTVDTVVHCERHAQLSLRSETAGAPLMAIVIARPERFFLGLRQVRYLLLAKALASFAPRARQKTHP
jgi:hypothetical protein